MLPTHMSQCSQLEQVVYLNHYATDTYQSAWHRLEMISFVKKWNVKERRYQICYQRFQITLVKGWC